jgi:hypothetical protein
MSQIEDQMYEANIGVLAIFETSTAAERGVVETFTDANARLFRQFEEHSKEVN